MPNAASSGDTRERYVFIDALRGIAALGVLFHHMLHNSVMEATLRRVLPSPLVQLSFFGAYGVQVFFVLSGFVIAHSLRDNPLTRASIGNFILRRQIRLDPPYWFMIVVALFLHRIELAVPSLSTPPMPSVGSILLNLFYLQNLTGSEEIVGVAWTLCIEIQFYLFFIALLALGKKLDQALDARKKEVSAVLIFITGCVSLAAVHGPFHAAWFVQYWFYFASGVLCCWSVQGRTSQWTFISYAALFAMSLSPSLFESKSAHERSASGAAMVVGFATAVAIYIGGRRGRLTRWGNQRILQYFGRISYSLYLSHLTCLLIVLRGGYKLTKTAEKPAVLWFILAGLASVVVAHVLFIVIERPSMTFASRIKRVYPKPTEPDSLRSHAEATAAIKDSSVLPPAGA